MQKQLLKHQQQTPDRTSVQEITSQFDNISLDDEEMARWAESESSTCPMCNTVHPTRHDFLIRLNRKLVFKCCKHRCIQV